MTLKKVSIIAIAGAVLLAGAIGIAVSLTRPDEMEIEVPETPMEQGVEPLEEGSRTLENMENMPIYFDDADVLLLPLRNVMEGLGGTVKWDAETRGAEVSYRGRTLTVHPGKTEALLNGYEITLPKTMEMINGCLYADATLISAYYPGEVSFDRETRQVTLQTKTGTAPVVAVRMLLKEAEDKSYQIEVPVIVGLNDSNFEKNLNQKILEKLQSRADVFWAEESEGGSRLELTVQTGFCSGDFLSLWWEGTAGDDSVKLAENIDLLGQKSVTLEELLEQDSFAEIQAAAGAGWSPENFFLTTEGGLALLADSEDNGVELWDRTGEQQLQWKKPYQKLFQKQ